MVLASVALVLAMLALVVPGTLVGPDLPVQDLVVDTEAMKDSPWITMVDSVKASVNETKSQLLLLSMVRNKSH